mmetsp:Transcript_8150/g.18200  ORF Transcript_8150/g.18200 Transcript_8150/m.18200 type:complete len:510 (+) Transcript_8150:23-1552(+)
MGCGASVRVAASGAGKEVTEVDAILLEDVSTPKLDGEIFNACKYGLRCYQRNPAHLKEYVHPGDHNYRSGRVKFCRGQVPEFETLWQLFMYFDADCTGHHSRSQFEAAFAHLVSWIGGDPWGLEKAWTKTSGSKLGHVTFAQFATWAKSEGMEVPIGVGVPGGCRVCRFRSAKDGPRCKCVEYKPDESGLLCVCGHKASMHRSDTAELPACGLGQTANLLLHWKKGCEGLVEVQDSSVLGMLQEILSSSHKAEDNWTRDRGCRLHGVGHSGCSLACASANRVPVPSGFVLRRAMRNQNTELWEKYFIARTAITEECHNGSVEFCQKAVLSHSDLDAPLVRGCNEWRLLHGSSLAACRSICKANFSLSLAGGGATWKDADKERGTPLYGDGIYMAERITKADEYSAQLSQEALEELVAEGSLEGGEDVHTLKECYAMLLVRCVGGRTNIVTTNEIDRDKLRADVFNGQYHSVFGDRVSSLKKPYREVVVYDVDQVYPEYLLLYERSYCEH